MKKTPNKKSKSPGGSLTPGSASIPSPYREINTDGVFKFTALFQARTSTSDSMNCPSNLVMMSTSDMKKMRLFSGSCVSIMINSSNILLLQVGLSPKTQSGTLVMNRLWSSNFIDQSNREVTAVGDFGRYTS